MIRTGIPFRAVRIAAAVFLSAALGIAPGLADPAPSPSGPAVSASSTPPPLAVQKCASQCLQRTLDGKCATMGGENCGLNYDCVPHCIQRVSGGKCIAYTVDYCGSGATCSFRCRSRTSNGNCIVYGSDGCSTRL